MTENNNSYVYQDSSIVGVDHSTGNYAGIDVGLVRPTDASPLNERWATNFFYEYAEDNTDYDQRISGTGIAWQNEYVCKSGVTTDVTCGYIYKYDATYSDPNSIYPGTRYVSEIQPPSANYNYSDGGDSGAITYDPSTNVVYGIHSGHRNDTFGLMTKITDVIDLYSDSTYNFSVYSSSVEVIVAQ